MTGIRPFQTAALGIATITLMGAAPAKTLTITDLSCLPNGASPSGDGTGTCVATVSGGTGIYTYAWDPEPVRVSGNRARIPCILGSYRNVFVTVTDSNGATASASTTFFCGEGA